MTHDRRRLALALLPSLLVHALLLSLGFGGQGLGLPGFGFPWQARRIEAPELRVILMPAQVTATEPVAGSGTGSGSGSVTTLLQTALIEQPEAGGPTPGRTAEPIATEAGPAAWAIPAAPARPESGAVALAPPANPPLRTEEPGDAAPDRISEPAEIALARSDQATPVLPVAAPVPAPVIATASSAPSPETKLPTPRQAGDGARTRIDGQALALEAARTEAARQEAERLAEADREAQRAENARLAAERQVAARQAAARQESARQDAQRVEIAGREAERQELARQAAVRQDAARQPTARLEEAQADEARREASRRAMGRQLDEEAARRESASTAAGLPSRLAPSSSGARRARLFGRTDSNADLVLYAEAWARKIELNMTFEMVREAAKRPHADPLVTVAVRSDGSVESVTFVLSSGVAEIDDAIRRIVQSQLPYPAFPPGLAREFDLIDIRRTWHFDMAIRLQ